MKRKRGKKLQLSKETIRKLERNELSGVAGGLISLDDCDPDLGSVVQSHQCPSKECGFN